jgi:hypothetical protein
MVSFVVSGREIVLRMYHLWGIMKQYILTGKKKVQLYTDCNELLPFVSKLPALSKHCVEEI